MTSPIHVSVRTHAWLLAKRSSEQGTCDRVVERAQRVRAAEEVQAPGVHRKLRTYVRIIHVLQELPKPLARHQLVAEEGDCVSVGTVAHHSRQRGFIFFFHIAESTGPPALPVMRMVIFSCAIQMGL